MDCHRSNLVILTLVSKQSHLSMLEALIDEIEKGESYDFRFASTYIIPLDFFTEKALFAKISSSGASFRVEQFPCKNEELEFIKIAPAEFSATEDDKKYLMICRDIFDDSFQCQYDDAPERRKWNKEFRIWGISV